MSWLFLSNGLTRGIIKSWLSKYILHPTNRLIGIVTKYKIPNSVWDFVFSITQRLIYLTTQKNYITSPITNDFTFFYSLTI
jgi:hypothetical protein